MVRHSAWFLSAAFLLIGSLLPSSVRANPPLGPGSECYWPGTYPAGSPTFPGNPAWYLKACVGSTPEAAEQCMFYRQNYPSTVMSAVMCQTYTGNRTDMPYTCGTGGYLSLTPQACAVSTPYGCFGHNPQNMNGPASPPNDPNCTSVCSSGYRDNSGTCTTAPDQLADTEDENDTQPEICETPQEDKQQQMEQPTISRKGIRGMCTVNARVMSVSINIKDIPVGYRPAVGPGVYIGLAYNQKDKSQPGVFSYSNVGPQWTMNTISFVTDNPATPGASIKRYLPNGGAISYFSANYVYTTATGEFTRERETKAVLVRIPATGAVTSYELRFPDGTKHVYAALDGATAWPRRVFLSQIVDPQGNALSFTYDGTMRLTTITDAISRATTFSYTATDPLLVTRITDPFGRHADITYDGAGYLSTITDTVGITSSVTYATGHTFVNALTTPYGTTNFDYGETGSDDRWLEITDRLGKVSRLEYKNAATGIAAAAPTPAPTGIYTNGPYDRYNSFFWDAYQYPLAITKSGGVITAQDFTKASLTHFNINPQGQVSGVPAATKQPLEHYVHVNYVGFANGGAVGSLNLPLIFGRVLDDGTTQRTRFTYNAWGKPLSITDAVTRWTYFTYDTNNVDLLTVKQSNQLIVTLGSYNSQHLPAAYTGADGQTYNIAYNTAGQTIYTTSPLGETRFWEYDGSKRLTRVTVPVAVAFASVVYGTTNVTAATAYSFTYDGYDRVATRTDSEGLVLTYTYDNLDRVTRITYPDTSYDDYDYNFQSGTYVGTPSLDLRKVTDRSSRVTAYDYDAERRLLSVTEPLTGGLTPASRTTSYAYYDNGVLKSITDANGAVTSFSIDLQGRVTGKTYAAGTALAKTESYGYETTTSRLKTVTDALSQVKTYSYNADDTLAGIAYTASVNTTPNVSFTWDSVYLRLNSFVDGTGTTTLTYVPRGTICNPPTATTNCGALKLASIDGAYANDVITYTYDKLGRINARAITGGNESFTYDLLGRLSTHGTGLGTFTYGYLNNTGQISSRSVTNGSVTVSTLWGYDTNAHDRQLINIDNSGVTRDYALSYLIPGGGGARNPYTVQNITDTAAATHPWATQSHAYTYDLADRLLTAGATTPGNSTFAYDALDNATSWSDSTGSFSPTYNVNNQLATRGSNTYAYDSNGNTLSGDGLKTYKYDAEDRLIEIDYVGGTNKTVFTYNALGQRILTAETVSGTTTTTRSLWCGATVCQTRTSADVATRRHYAEGELNVTSGQKLIYMPDQLGSTRDVVDATTGTLVKAYDYSPYGAITRNWGSIETDYRYAGLFYHPSSALSLAKWRGQDATIGRWINKDPIKELGGINLYGYVEANPVGAIDPLGLEPETYGAVGFECWARCVRSYDPLNPEFKLGLTLAGGTFPKWLVGLPRGVAGASRSTTVPSLLAYFCGGGGAGTAGGAARLFGRTFSPIWIGYGVYLVGAEAYCAGRCSVDATGSY